MFKNIFKNLIDDGVEDVKEEASTFVEDHPLATCAMVVMGAVIFAQHIELRCLRIMWQPLR